MSKREEKVRNFTFIENNWNKKVQNKIAIVYEQGKVTLRACLLAYEIHIHN